MAIGVSRVGSLFIAATWSACVGLSGCADDSAAGTHYELEGYVREDLTGRALSGVDVRFTSDTLATATARTDEDGIYRMGVTSDTPFGQVRAEKTGFAPAEASVYFDTSRRRIDLVLREAAGSP